MKIIFNTNYESAGTVVLRGLQLRLQKEGYEIYFNDWSDYHKYDIAIFMAPDSEIQKAKKINPKIKCGIFDPKCSKNYQIKESQIADFLIVSSIEQRDHFLKYNKNIFIYYMFPDIPEIPKTHLETKKIIIGYHGNKQHLDSMKNVSWALDKLTKEYDIELWAVYNYENLGKWVLNIPKKCPVKHIQWSPKNLTESIKKCDIGVVPSVLKNTVLARPIRSFVYNPEGYSMNDYNFRFKMSNNPGRIYVFSQLSVPVVADFTPSACQIIKDGESGFIVGTKEGWYQAFERLIKDFEIRNTFSDNLKSFIKANHSIEINFKNFVKYINSL